VTSTAGLRPRTLLLVALAVTAWAAPAAWARASHGARTTADEPHYLITAISLGEDFDLDVADERREQRWRDFHEAPLLVQEAVLDRGRRVSPHDPLLPALLAVPMRAGGWLASKLFLAALAGALAAATLWTAVRRFGVRDRVAVITVLGFAAGAPLAIYATQVYPEVPAALAVVGAVAAVTGPLDRRGVLLLGACVVALPWLAVKYAPVALVLAVLGLARLWRRGERTRAAWLVLALGAAALAFFVLHAKWYGGATPYATGNHFGSDELSVIGNEPDYLGRSVRLAGLLVDRDFGLVAWHPAWLLAVPALAAVAWRRPHGWDALVAPMLAGWLVATFVALTMHGWWFPGRQVVHVLPCAVLCIAWFADRVSWARALVIVGGLVGASITAWLVVEALLGDITIVVDYEQMTHPIARLVRLTLPDYRDGRLGDHVLHAIWLAAISALAWLGIRATRATRESRRDVSLPLDDPRESRTPVLASS
jgi:hypothetical protein